MPDILRIECDRITTREVRIVQASPIAALADVPVIADSLSDAHGRMGVTLVTEWLRQDANGSVRYTVHAEGPRITPTGRLHSRNKGRRTWSLSITPGRAPFDSTGDIPESIRALLAGPLALLDMTLPVPPSGD